jgi:hypothetical protein
VSEKRIRLISDNSDDLGEGTAMTLAEIAAVVGWSWGFRNAAKTFFALLVPKEYQSERKTDGPTRLLILNDAPTANTGLARDSRTIPRLLIARRRSEVARFWIPHPARILHNYPLPQSE